MVLSAEEILDSQQSSSISLSESCCSGWSAGSFPPEGAVCVLWAPHAISDALMLRGRNSFCPLVSTIWLFGSPPTARGRSWGLERSSTGKWKAFFFQLSISRSILSSQDVRYLNSFALGSSSSLKPERTLLCVLTENHQLSSRLWTGRYLLEVTDVCGYLVSHQREPQLDIWHQQNISVCCTTRLTSTPE